MLSGSVEKLCLRTSNKYDPARRHHFAGTQDTNEFTSVRKQFSHIHAQKVTRTKRQTNPEIPVARILMILPVDIFIKYERSRYY